MILYLIPCPIAPETATAVLSPQVIEVITNTKYFFVENIRTARRFISELKIGLVIDDLHFFELSKETEAKTVANYFKRIPKTQPIGVLSEAGCPGIADPGALAVAAAHKMGWKVVPLVGPSSIFLALMASGFNGQSFVFHGYLPIEKEYRAKKIRFLEREVQQYRQTQIFMETPYRNNTLFDDLVAILHPDTLLCVAANLTDNSQAFIQTQRMKQWILTKPQLHKQPALFLIGES